MRRRRRGRRAGSSHRRSTSRTYVREGSAVGQRRRRISRQPPGRLAWQNLGVVDAGTLLRLDGVTKRYPGVIALDDLSIEVPRGRIGLVGANGAGKTTTFRL